MPVWHDALKPLIAEKKLVLIGITQEQHPERCQLFAQWKGFEFPILWDAFNLTDSKVVPNFIAIDEHGIVRSMRAKLDTFEAEFLSVEFEAPSAQAQLDVEAGVCSFAGLHGRPTAVSDLSQHKNVDASVTKLREFATNSPQDAIAAFRAGVALRMRYDSEFARPEDFQSAVDEWTRALRLDPNQYIWRRRIQQYGPRMDKPYPFYTWTEEARSELLARGETPIALRAQLTPAELAEPRSEAAPLAQDLVEPDPDGKIQRDASKRVSIETAIVLDTSGKEPIASVHIGLRPDKARDVHWNHEAGPPIQVWISSPAPRMLEVAPRGDVATSSELQTLNFEAEFESEAKELTWPAYALYYVCEGVEGKCLYLRQDFEIRLSRP